MTVGISNNVPTTVLVGAGVPLSPCGRCERIPTARDRAGQSHWAMVQLSKGSAFMHGVLCPECVEHLYRDVCGPIDDTIEVAKAVVAGA